LRIFRDESSLSANPHLWSSIVAALDDSEWFVLLLSPDAATSKWVNQEIEHWTTNKDPNRILPVLTDGEFTWTDGGAHGSAVPDALRGVFEEEPRWVDLRFAREEDDLDLKNPSFSNAVADVASAIRGIPKDELSSEEVKQHRRTVRTASGGVALVGLLAIAATVFAVQSANNAQKVQAERQNALDAQFEAEAERQTAEAERDRASQEADRANTHAEEAALQARLAKARELAASSIAVQDSDPELATLLSIEAIHQSGGGAEALFPEGLISLRQAVDSNQLVNRADFSGEGFVDVAFTADGSGIVITSPRKRQVALYSTDALQDPIWTYEDPTTNDLFIKTSVHPDGTDLAIIVAENGEDDGKQGRVVILDASTGEETRTIDLGGCVEPVGSDEEDILSLSGFSGGGAWFSLKTVGSNCAEVPGFYDEVIYDTTTWTEVQRLSGLNNLQDGDISFTSDDSTALIHYTYGTSELRSLPDFELVATFNLTVGDRAPPWVARISPDGRYIAGAMAPPDDNRAGFWSATDGEFLGWSDGYRGIARRLVFTRDGQALVAGTDSAVLYDTLEAIRIVELHTTGATNGVDISSDGQSVVTSSLTGIVELWNLNPEGTRLAESVGWVNPNDFIEGDPLGLRAFEIDGGYSLFVLDSTTGRVVNEFLTHAPSDGQAGGQFVVAVGGLGPAPDIESRGDQEYWLGPVVLWDPVDGSSTDLRDCELRWFGVSPDDKCPDGEPLFGTDLRVSPDGAEVAGVSEDGQIRVWNAKTLRTVREVDPETGIGLLQFNDGWFLTGAVGDSPAAVESLYAIDDETGALLAEFSGSWRWHVNATNSDGSRLYLMDQSGSVFEYDSTTWQLLHSWRAQQSRTRGIAVSPDDSKIATSGEDGLIWIWQVSGTEPRLLDRIPVSGDMVSDIVWLDDEHMGAVVLLDWGHVRWQTIDLSSGAVVEMAVDDLVRGFSQSECETYDVEPCPTLDEMRSR
jgi:WD40 repeat protein